ncbi:MAG: coenzyme hydrogenase subunit beta [Solirubrobacteraceae bacterium]
MLDAASAGGAVTTLLIAALRNGLIDAALVIGRDPERPWIPQARLVDSEQQIIDCAQASYCITPNLQLLADTTHQRVGLAALPCQVEAIEKMRALSQRPAVADKIALTIEIACSSNTRRTGTEHLITERLGLPLTSTADMRYRSGQYPGDFTVTDSGGTRHTVPFHELVLTFKQFKTFRCKACPDWWSGVADLSVADGDPNIFRTSRNSETKPKTSLLVTRTDRGNALVDLAMRQGLLEALPGDFDPETNLGLQRKHHRYLRHRERHPNAVPTPPMDVDRQLAPLQDDEVIERLSPGRSD